MKAILVFSLAMVAAGALGALQGYVRGKRFAKSLKEHLERQKVDRRDLPKDTDLSGFRLSLSVYLSPGDDAKETEAPLGSEWVLSDVAWGGVYQLTLRDNEDNGFEVWD